MNILRALSVAIDTERVRHFSRLWPRRTHQLHAGLLVRLHVVALSALVVGGVVVRACVGSFNSALDFGHNTHTFISLSSVPQLTRVLCPGAASQVTMATAVEPDAAVSPKPDGWRLLNIVMATPVTKAHDYRGKAAKLDLIPVV